MRVYVAADFGRAPEAEEVAQSCAGLGGVEVVSRWHRQASPEEASASGRIGGPTDPVSARAAAERNLADLDRADTVVVLTTGSMARGGRHFETGYAYAAGKAIVLVGPVEHAFHHLPGMATATLATVCEVVSALAASANRDDGEGTPALPGRDAARCVEAQGFTLPAAPTLDVDDALHVLWPALLAEELDEFREALAGRDLVEVADALADLIYVAYSAGATYGLPMDAVVAEVHRSNLTKIAADGVVSKRSDGKVLKPETFSPPRIAQILDAAANNPPPPQ